MGSNLTSDPVPHLLFLSWYAMIMCLLHWRTRNTELVLYVHFYMCLTKMLIGKNPP